MGIVIRQSIKASIVSYAGALIGAITVIIIYPYFLQPDLIGLIRVITEAGLLFSLFSMIGANNAFVKFFPENRNRNSISQFLGFLILVSLAGFIVILLLYGCFSNTIVSFYSEKSGLVNSYFIYAIPLTLLFTGITILEVYSAQMLRIVFPKIIREIIIRCLTILLVLAFAFYTLNLSSFVQLFVVIYLFAFVLLIFYVKKITSEKPVFNLSAYVKNNRKSYFKYMIIIFAFNVSMAIATRADLFIITSKLSLRDTGIYSIAFFISAFIDIPIRSIIQIVSPLVSKTLEENNIPQLNEYYKKVAINQLLISSLIFMVLWINIDALYSFMPNGSIYAVGKYAILFLGLSKIVDAATGVNAVILNYSKYYSYSVFFVIMLAVVTIGSNLIFIPIWGITGAAFATFLSLFVYQFIMVFFVWQKFKIQPFTLKTIIAIFIILFCIGITAFIPIPLNLIAVSVIKTTIVTFIFVFLVYKFKISDDFNSILSQVVRFRKISDLFRMLMPK